MRRIFFFLLAFMPVSLIAQSSFNMKRVSVHDPSIVKDNSSKRWYIFGSHRAAAYTEDLMNWTGFAAPWGTASNTNAPNALAFVNNQMKKVPKGGQEVDFINFNALLWSSAYGDYDINGNMWAPDVIYNKAMGKWCMYLSINGPRWNSSIILLTSDKINGPYRYQGPVIISGFNVSDLDQLSFRNTDLELAIGELTKLPPRYERGDRWGNFLPHCIDPCVFYDEEGLLWMTYGSWSGGIFIIRLNEQNGLRDYDVTYPETGSGQSMISDPYFGRKIAGGCYVSGEASYIEHIGDYYYLFVTNGGLEQTGGYQMRVFRSTSPTGPYKDPKGQSAIYSSYALNFGPNSTNRGENIFGAYGDWGYMSDGERSQGHSSIVAADDGRTYLVYHTRFQNGGEGHQVRVHQVFLNQDGWLCAAPFEYTGEVTNDADIANNEFFNADYIAGDYKIMIHRYGLDHAKKALVTPSSVKLNSNGTVTGALNGTWELTPGTCYLSLKINNVVYKGVLVVQMMEPRKQLALAFTGMSDTGVTAWAYKTIDELPANVNELTVQTAIKHEGIYDLQGRRLNIKRSSLPPGIYIINGRKTVIAKK